jgi:hypothetical protein
MADLTTRLTYDLPVRTEVDDPVYMKQIDEHGGKLVSI